MLQTRFFLTSGLATAALVSVALAAGSALGGGGCSNDVSIGESVPAFGDASGIEPAEDGGTKQLIDLTDDEARILCDWTAAQEGGYGRTFACDSGATVTTKRDPADCLNSFPFGCRATVGEWENCRRKEATDPCAFFMLTAPECSAIRNCTGKLDGGPRPDATDKDTGD